MTGGWSKTTENEGSDSENECTNVRDQLYDYADATTIHGIKYTLEKGRTLVERSGCLSIFVLLH